MKSRYGSDTLKDTDIQLNEQELIITGALTQDTVMVALEKCRALLPTKQSITVNLKDVSRCDSASLAFLLALIRESKGKQIQLKFIHLPKQMSDLGKVSGLESILPL